MHYIFLYFYVNRRSSVFTEKLDNKDLVCCGFFFCGHAIHTPSRRVNQKFFYERV